MISVGVGTEDESRPCILCYADHAIARPLMKDGSSCCIHYNYCEGCLIDLNAKSNEPKCVFPHESRQPIIYGMEVGDDKAFFASRRVMRADIS